MKLLLLSLLSILPAICLFAQETEKASFIKYPSTTLAIRNVQLMDGSGQPPKAKQTVLISNGIIQAVGASDSIPLPSQAIVIEGSGKTLIPGLIGMHNHMHLPGQPFLGEAGARLYLAAGITTLQSCGSASPREEIALAKAIDKGTAIGPSIIPSAPYITGPGGNQNMIIPRDEQHLRDTVHYWLAQGVRWFKVYRNTRPEDLAVLTQLAHAADGKVRGHLCSITFGEATALGIDGIEHGLNSLADFREGKEPGHCGGNRSYIDSLSIDDASVIAIQKEMIAKGVFLCSTLSAYEASISHRATADERSLSAMAPWLKEQYENRKQRMGATPDLQRENRLHRIMAFEKQYAELGGLLCAGVDAGRHVLPGFGDQRNYQLLLEAGFAPEEAIRIMTYNGALALENDRIGLIKPGMQADLVLLDGKLNEHSEVIEQVIWVMKKGQAYDSQKLIESVRGQLGL